MVDNRPDDEIGSKKASGGGNGSESDLRLEQLEMEFLKVHEVAKILRVSEYLVYELIRRCEIPHIRVGGRILVPRYRLAEWIERNTIKT